MGYFKDIDWIRVYIISPCTKSRMLLSMLHALEGYLGIHGYGSWMSRIFVESTINKALEVYLGIQGYSAFFKGYGIFLKFLNGILGI